MLFRSERLLKRRITQLSYLAQIEQKRAWLHRRICTGREILDG
jgi:hypothetical protein